MRSGWNELCSWVKIGHQTYLSWTAELSDPIISLRCSIAWLPNLSIEVLDYWTYKLTTLPSIPKQMRSDWKWTKQLRSGWNELCSWVKIGHQTYLIWTAEFRLNRICMFEHTNSIWSGRWSGYIRLWSGIFWPYSTSNAQKSTKNFLRTLVWILALSLWNGLVKDTFRSGRSGHRSFPTGAVWKGPASFWNFNMGLLTQVLLHVRITVSKCI